jgi:hypothetical protein
VPRVLRRKGAVERCFFHSLGYGGFCLGLGGFLLERLCDWGVVKAN